MPFQHLTGGGDTPCVSRLLIYFILFNHLFILAQRRVGSPGSLQVFFLRGEGPTLGVSPGGPCMPRHDALPRGRRGGRPFDSQHSTCFDWIETKSDALPERHMVMKGDAFRVESADVDEEVKLVDNRIAYMQKKKLETTTMAKWTQMYKRCAISF